jgi:F0F1-type ATP synthase delta subunit
MDRRDYKQMAEASITNNALDPKKVEKIAGLLSNSELKLYIKALKKWVSENTVIVEVPDTKKVTMNELTAVFKNKDVKVAENPSLLLGMRIKDGDDIYEMSLANTLSQIEKHVLEGYDR